MTIFYLSFGGAVLCLATSFMGWTMPMFGSVVALVLSVGVFILYFRAPLWALSAVVAELAFGGKGWWLAMHTGDVEIPVRMLLFGGVLAAWMVRQFFSFSVFQSIRVLFNQYDARMKFFLCLLAVSVLWGMGWGMVRGNSFAAVFLDANGWWYWALLLPMAAAIKDEKGLPRILACVSGTGLALSLLTIALYHIFDHQYPVAETLYRWIRDTLLGEITFIRSGAWRIFTQSQVWLLVVWAWAAARGAAQFFGRPRRAMGGPDALPPAKIDNSSLWGKIGVGLILVLSSSALIISFSRSFWVGWGVMAILFFSFSVFQFKVWRRAVAIIALSMVGGFLLATLAQRIPSIPAGFPLKERLALEEAGSSRIAQLKPLLRTIVKHPVIGSGFGTTVTYRSADPRIVSGTAGGSGKFTTSAFEWGYLDIWLKIGLIGLISLVGLIGNITKKLWDAVKEEGKEGIALTLMLSLAALMAVNVFSPYLNHPLGIGMVILSFAYVQSFRSHRHA